MRALSEYARMTEARLNELLPEQASPLATPGVIPRLLTEAMRYSLFAGGKRLRPAMLLAAYELTAKGADAKSDEALDAACAIEMIHTYSLIHDDLPGMDDDVMRRGRPTNHVVYGVGQAILAGDGLLTMAFEVMLRNATRYNQNMDAHIRAIGEIARGAGVTGMVAGQCLDLYAELHAERESDLLNAIHRGKTMAMFVAAVRAGACLACASKVEVDALTRFAEAFGLLFQASDDLLDVTANEKALGKSTGKDARDGKLTAVSLLSIDGARARVDELSQAALEALQPFDGRADFFRMLTMNMASRKA